MAGGERTILLTGASGVVGRAVAAELRAHVIGLVHSDTDVPEVDELVPCDLSVPRLGLDERTWRALAERIDGIVHSGALTAWGQPRERYERINCDGTRRVIELALAAGAPIQYISTCFVRALQRMAYDDLSAGNVVKPYVWSKLEAERLLAESGAPHSIFRPTNMVGDSRTGASSRPQIVQMMADWILRGKAPFFPAHPSNRIDVAPMDLLAIPVARAAEAGDVGRELWVTYGEDAMTVPEALDVLAEHARSRGRTLDRAPVVDPSVPLPIPLEGIAPTSRAFVSVLLDVSETTYASGGVLPTSRPELIRRYGAPDVPDVEAFRRSLDFWARERAPVPVREGAA